MLSFRGSRGPAVWLLMASGMTFVQKLDAISRSELTLQRAAGLYAAYGGVYIGVAVLWLWLVDKVQPSITDLVGVLICLVGMAVIMFGARGPLI